MKPNTPITARKTALALAAMTLVSTLAMGRAEASPKDLDGDGIANRIDRDVDGDGASNGRDRNVDGGVPRKGRFKGKFVGDRLRNDDLLEKDIDGDGIPDRTDDDIDGDGVKNGKDDDCDADGSGRARDRDDDGDGVRDDKDGDDDNDGFTDDDENEVEAPLFPTADAPAGSRARVKVKLLPSGEIELEFDGRNLAAGDYDVVVNGQTLGTLEMVDDDGRTEGEVEFETTPDDTDELPLPFNPFGLPVVIGRNGVVYFSGTVPTPSDIFSPDDNSTAGRSLTSNLTKGAGLPREAEGSVEIQLGTKGVTGLEVEVERIPVGVYDFLVAGVQRGALSVVLVNGKAKGKLRYEVSPDDNDELPLNFTVSGQAVAIVQGGKTWFSGKAPGAN
jgi:hypothetical protein